MSLNKLFSRSAFQPSRSTTFSDLLFRAMRRGTASSQSRRQRERKDLTTLVETCEQRVMLAGHQTAWSPLGPFSATDGQVENVGVNDEIVGAIHTVIAHPTNADILYIGGTNGGVWRTIDATSADPNWVPLTDNLPSQSIGALAFDSTDPSGNTVYAGTGRYSSFGRRGNNRIGLLQTTDGGANWNILGGNVLAGANISGIAANGNNIVVSVNSADNFTLANVGIFRSTDGGASFARVSVGNGNATGLPEGVSYDLVVDPIDANTLYTSMTFSSSDGVYKSSDAGASWTKVSTAAIDALFVNNTSNVELAVGRSNEVYVGIINAGSLAGLFRSPDGGATWGQMDTPATNENGIDVGLNPKGSKGPLVGSPEEIAGGQGSIHFSITADPNLSNIVYVGGDRQPRTFGDTGGFPNSIGAQDFTGRLFRGDATAATGSQFVHLTHSNTLGAAGGGTANSSAPHADSRDMVFDANGNLLEVDDGGIYRRTSPQDNTGDWFSVIGNLQVTENHDISWDALSNTAITGNQDTGTTYQRAQGDTQWDSLSTADGGDVAVDNIELAGSGRSVRYTSFQGLQAFRRTVWDAAGNLLSTSFPALTEIGGSPNLQGAFRTPIETNSVTGGRLLIQGANSLYESLDGGATITEIGAGVSNSGGGSNAIWYGGSQNGVDNADLVWAASGSDVFVRTAGTGNVIQTAGDPTFSTIRELAVNSRDWTQAFVVDNNNQVFATDDTGTTWADITGNLLATAATDIYSLSFVSTASNDVIIAGTNAGVFAATLTNLGTWQQLGANLPNVLVFDMDYDASDDVIVAGTLGRGAWSLTNVSTNIDDAFGPVTDAFTVTINQATISENGGVASGTITRNNGISGDLIVTLTSDDLTEATVPATVTIPDGSNSVVFPITAVDDAIADGVQTVTITASALGFVAGTETIDITDDETVDLNFIRLDSLGSEVFADQNRQMNLTGPGDEAVFGFYGQAGEIFSAVVTPTDPNAIVTLEIVELNQAFSSTAPGQPLIVSGENLPLSQFYRIRITSSVASDITLDTYLNVTLEQQAIGGDSSTIQRIPIDDSFIDFGVGRYAILGSAGSVNDVDVYTVDLTGQAGKKVEIILSGLTQDFGAASLELQNQFGGTLAIASALPLGVDPTNVDLAILEFVVPANGIYRLEVTSPTAAGEYVLTVLTDNIGFELENNNVNTEPLRDLTNMDGATGLLSTTDTRDLYTVTLNAGEAIFLETLTPLDDPLGNPLNDLDPAIIVRQPDGFQIALDENSGQGAKNAMLSFIATQTGTYEIEVVARSGVGEYVMNIIINHPPDIQPNTFSIPENSPVGTLAGTATATDPDNDNLAYAIIGGNPGNTFSIDPNSGEIRVSNPTLLDFETMPFFDLIVEVTDDGIRNLTDSAIIRINLTDVNEDPTLNDQTFNINENSPNGTFVGQMVAGDVDAGDSQTYTIVSGNTNNVFAIDPVTGIITVNDVNELNHEITPQYMLVIRSTDTGGLFDEAIATINVLDINDQPVVDDQNFTIAENSAGGTSVGTVVATDEDVNPSDTLTYVIVSGNTDGAFAINSATGEITVLNPLAVNFEINPSFDLLVRVTDDGTPSLNDTAIIHIDVINRNDGVRVPFFDGFETYPAVNPPGTPLAPGAPWITNSTNVGRTWVTDAYQPFEGAKHLLLDSSVVDNQGSLNEAILEVNPNGADQLIFEFMEREYLDEDQPMPGIFTGSSNSDGVAISSDGNTWYRLVSLTGNTSQNFYQQFSFNLTTFAGEVGLDLTKNFFIKLQQFDQFPVGSDGIAFDNIRLINRSLVNLPPVAEDQLIYLNENPLQDLVVGHVQATDPNAGDALLYEIVSGNDTATETGVFSINPATGEIRVAKPAAIDAEVNAVFRLGIRVSDSGAPALQDTAEITIQVKNLQERIALFEDNFESGNLAKWTTSSTALGRILNTTDNGPAQGARHLTFDSITNSATISLNEAIFSFDGTGSSDIVLSMWQREFNDEDHPLPEMFAGSVNGDGISISVDGTTWYRVQSLIGPNSIDSYQRREYDLSALAAQKGLDLNQTVQVKIQAYDNFSIPFDGMAFDDVLVEANAAGVGGGANAAEQLAGLAIENGQLNWYVTSANGVQVNGTSQLWGTAGAATQGVKEVKTGDFNGDGREDVALQNNNGEWFIGLSDGTSFNQFRWTRWNTDNTSFSHVVVGDFNNDGRDDLLGMADNGIWWAAEAQGTQFGNKSWTRWSSTANWQEVQVGDFNNDGYDDIAGRTAGSAWWVGLSNGTQFQNSKFAKWGAAAGWQDVSFGDFNGDGMTDITGRAANGKWWTGLSDGTKFVTTNWAQWSATTNWQDVNVGDFNGDGMTDITGRAGNGKWWTALSNGTGFATTNWGQWSSTANWNDVVVGDFNGDGTDDVAGRLDNGIWWNALSQGNSFSNQQGVQWNSALNWVAVTVGDYDAPAIPVTPPPAAPIVLGPDFGGPEESNNEEEENLIIQNEFENGLLEQNEGLDTGNVQEAEEDAQQADLFDEAAVEEVFGDQSLLDLLADLG